MAQSGRERLLVVENGKLHFSHLQIITGWEEYFVPIEIYLADKGTCFNSLTKLLRELIR